MTSNRLEISFYTFCKNADISGLKVKDFCCDKSKQPEFVSQIFQVYIQ